MLNNREVIGDSSDWVLCRARYFDASTLCFRTADIEISGGKITAVLSPDESGAKVRVDGSGTTCVPGLAGELVVDSGDNEFDFFAYASDVLKCGVTTVSVVTDRPAEIAADARRAGIRVEIYCSVRDQSLGQSISGKGSDIDRALDAHIALVRLLDDGLIRISPAIVSQSFASSNLTVRLHALAKASGKRLLVNVDSGRPHHDAFHDAYHCSGTLLLRSLNVLDASTIAIVDSALSHHDLNLLADSAAGVGVMDCAILANGMQASRNLRRVLCSGRGALMCRRLDVITRSTEVARVSQAFGWATLPNIAEIADIIVDAMTRAGSVAVGLATIGRVDANEYADFAIYDSPVLVSSVVP